MQRPDKPWKTFSLDTTVDIIDESIYFGTREFLEKRSAQNPEGADRQSDDDSDIVPESSYDPIAVQIRDIERERTKPHRAI